MRANTFDVVEKLVDQVGVSGVLFALKAVMQEKAEHINYDWQDSGLAKKWMSASVGIATCIKKLPKVPGIK